MLAETGLWADVRELPASLQATLDAADGIAETAALLGARDVRRIVASGNGAAYYVALALWLAALRGRDGPEVVAVPSGLIAEGWFRWRPGDRLLAVSSSGEFRDLVRAIERGAPRPYAAVTATAGSTVERDAGARALQRVLGQRAATHTQALAGGVACALAVWADLTGDGGLREALAAAPDAAESAIVAAERWEGEVDPALPAPPAAVAFSPGPGWAAALEAALLLKEIARVPCEGVETREGATSAMYGLAPGHLAVSLPLGEDEPQREAECVCAGAGARVVSLPGGTLADRRLALVTTLPAACALAATLAGAAGHDVDRPAWTDAYYATARADTAREGRR